MSEKISNAELVSRLIHGASRIGVGFITTMNDERSNQQGKLIAKLLVSFSTYTIERFQSQQFLNSLTDNRERDCAVASLQVMAELMRAGGGPELPEWVTRDGLEVDAP